MPAKINLPVFLEEKLRDATYEPVVRTALQDFGKWFDESKQTFFPDYTNHGIQHIGQVLDTAANLIPAAAESYFSKDDAAALILAVLLHDSALHLSKTGFWNLIKGPNQYAPLSFFDRTYWGQTWTDFMFLARRWDDTMLSNVFGKEDDGAPRAQVRDPFDYWTNLTETDELLIGEFIRKHHPRLAHEMALYGVPGSKGVFLALDDKLPLAWRDLVGLIARSHGLPLRTGLDYLKKTPHFGTFAHRDYKSVHAVYLMALLRVGDYIQIQGDRTSERVFEFKDIRSLVSQVEHKAHLSDIIITDKTDDPESLQIDAHPQEVAVFLRLKAWLAGIQQELDSSWAVLGEVYGLQHKLKYLGLTFRRVRSNLDDVAEFAKTVPYVPDRIRFDVARAELLKLLIGPLYGDDPSYGVRELMQNSIDAVREYDQFVLDNLQYKDVPRREQEADVVIELGPLNEATGYAVMTISDRGIGMTEATIRDYFLRAGASFRQSAEWKTAFEADDSEGANSKILRSGRFGVGALAAFLIGDELEVQTRHISDTDGYSFATSLSTESISVFQNSEITVGTHIKMRVNASSYQKLLKNNVLTTRPAYWDWYSLKYPSVKRYLYHSKKGRLQPGTQYRFDENLLNEGWRKLPLQQSYEVYWSYDSAPSLTCNGLFVNDSSSLRHVTLDTVARPSGNGGILYPRVAVLDRDGAFPLNLQRDALRTREYPFGKELVKDTILEMFGWLLFNGPEALDSVKISMGLPNPWLGYGNRRALVACTQGFGIRCSNLLDGLHIGHVAAYSTSEVEIRLTTSNTLVFGAEINSYSYDSLLMFTIINQVGNISKPSKYVSRYFSYRGGFAKKKAPRFLNVINPSTKKIEAKLNVDVQNGSWLVLASENCPSSQFGIVTWPSQQPRGRKEDVFEERFYQDGAQLRVHSAPWLLDDLWQEHFGKNWIPFALADRLAKFPAAAQFFKERYPQVVPDEAWALLGGKPSEEK